MPLDEVLARRYARKSAFLEFCERDGLAVITGYSVDDLTTAPLKHWERWGGPAAYCHLEGSQGFVGVIIAEITAGTSLKAIRHKYEEIVMKILRRDAKQLWDSSAQEI